MQCFVALGGNFENSLKAFILALHQFAQTQGIWDLVTSRLYQTSPVSPIQQPSYLNAAASFQTSLTLLELFALIESIERDTGKTKKEKNAPRLIDIDLLFYGNAYFKNEFLEVPHPRLGERLFVLAPLSDLMDTKLLMRNFKNINNEKVQLLSIKLPYDKKS